LKIAKQISFTPELLCSPSIKDKQGFSIIRYSKTNPSSQTSSD